MRVTLWGAGANVSLAALKYVAGYLAGSSALIADAAHSLSDLLTDVVTLVAVELARLPPDEGHPFGHGRFEAVGSLSVAAVLVGAAGGVGWNSLSVLTEMLHGSAAVENALALSGYGGLALGACVVSIMTKEALYWATVRVGRQVNSQTLIANAWHHRSDAFSSIAALVGVGGSLAGIPMLDPAAGLVVAALVAKVGVEIGLEVFEEVMVSSEPLKETCEEVRTLASATIGVLGVDQVRARKMGPYSLVDFRIIVDPHISVSAARQIAERIRQTILTTHESVSDVVVHVSPEVTSGTFADVASMRPHTEVESEVHTALEAIPEIEGVSNVTLHYVPQRGIHLKVDIACDSGMTLQHAAGIARKAKKVLEGGVPGVYRADISFQTFFMQFWK